MAGIGLIRTGNGWVFVDCASRLPTAHNSTWLIPEPPACRAAFDLTASWLAQPSATIAHPGPRHLQILGDLLRPLGSGGHLTSDAHLAALAIEHRAELYSADGDFARFSGLKWRNPLS